MWRYALTSGSMLVMRGSTQRHWEHCVPKLSESEGGARINITFRQTLKSE